MFNLRFEKRHANAHLAPNSNKLLAYDGILARENGNEVPVMNDITAVVVKQSRQKCETLKCSENETIQRYYGQIGIPAVAAAVRYQGDSKNPAYAPVKIHV
jgi:hypothetical protein